MKEIAKFLEIEHDESDLHQMVQNCLFATMGNKKHPLGPNSKHVLRKPKKFVYKVTNGRWTDVLRNEDAGNYRHLARRQLNLDGMPWLQTGK